MTISAVLLDLDDTLLVDADAVEEALLRTCQRARGAGADPLALATGSAG